MYAIIFCGRVIVMKKKQLVCSIIFLFFLTIVMVMIITPSSYLFGSNTDWLSQHVNLADYLRHTMIENKTLFPDFAFNIGAGVNIYNLSYYGLFRPDVLIGCLIPSVAMKDIIIIYMVINLILSVNLLYIWLKSKILIMAYVLLELFCYYALPFYFIVIDKLCLLIICHG